MTYQSSLQPISCSLSLSSCRLKAEAIARALNNRIWPTALINDFDEHSSGDEALQVTASSKSSRGTKSGSVIDRPPQSHAIYDSGDRVIGHCWLNGMQTDDDDEYFDTPPCSSPPSPAEDEIIVNPPTYNGISPFFSEYSYQQLEQHNSEEMPSSTGYRDDERIASGTKLFEKLQRYSESLSQNEDTSETFYDVSDYEDYEEQSTNLVNEADRQASSSTDVVQSTTVNECQTTEEELQKMPDTVQSHKEGENENSDPPLLLTDIDIAVNAEENVKNCVATVDSENAEDCVATVDSENAENCVATVDSENAENCVATVDSENAENCVATVDSENAENLLDPPENANSITNDLPDEITCAVPETETDETEKHDCAEEVSHDFNKFSRRKTKFVSSHVLNVTGESSKNPEIGIVPPTPLPTSTSFSSNYSEDDLRDLPSDPAADSSTLCHLSTDFRFRRIQELEEEDRPKLLRSISLKTGKTPPGTPGRKKIVRFADALGLDLEAVRHIVQDDLPNVPSSAYVDLKLEDVDGQQLPVTKSADRISYPGSLWDPGAVPGVGSGVQSLIPQFQPPSTKPDFIDRVRNQYVCLENIIVSDLTLHCTCRVLNIAFEKFVAARYTTNDWQTCEEVIASYVPNSSDGVFDKFSFSLFLRHLLPHQRLLFAIRYTVGGAEYWDNNYGENYVLRSHSNAPALPSTEDGPSWMHHFY